MKADYHSIVFITCAFSILLSLVFITILSVQTVNKRRHFLRYEIVTIPYIIIDVLLFLFWFSQCDDSFHRYMMSYFLVVSIGSIAGYCEIFSYAVVTRKNMTRELLGLIGLYYFGILLYISNCEILVPWGISGVMAIIADSYCRREQKGI